MAQQRRRVECGCGWKGKRVPGECACYDECALFCSCLWGRCPKCKGRVSESEYLREMERRQEEADAWWEANGAAEMARLGIAAT